MDDNRTGISSFWLKVAAIVAMTCNHVANVFAASLPLPLLLGLYALGGVTFPIMAFLLVEGFRHTSSVRRYALRLGAFAIVSQVPYSLLWGAVPNVLFTLLVGLGVLVARRQVPSKPLFALVAMAAVLVTFPFDWGLIGVLIVLLFQELREGGRGLDGPDASDRQQALSTAGVGSSQNGARQAGGLDSRERWRVVAVMGVAFLVVGLSPLIELIALGPAALGGLALPPGGLVAADPSLGSANTILQAGAVPALWGDLLYATVGFGVATALIWHYDGRRGRSMKWFFYAFYPLHLAVIAAAKMLLGL